VRSIINSLIRALRQFKYNKKASIGIGSLIIFIAMIMVAGIAASVIIQTMNNLEQQAMQTGEEVMRDISSGIKVTQVSGHNNGTDIDQLAIFIALSAGSESIDLTYTYISLSDTSTQAILSYSNTEFSSSVSNGLFGTLNASNLTATTFGVMVVRDIDSSCSSTTPTINKDDLVVLLVNTSQCFTGIDPRDEVFGNIVPEQGISGVIGFTTPNSFVDTIINLQP
jgi:flagellin FlaB